MSLGKDNIDYITNDNMYTNRINLFLKISLGITYIVIIITSLFVI